MTQHSPARPEAQVLAAIIRGIGQPDFASMATQAVLDYMDFNLGAVVIHRARAQPELVFDNFEGAEGRVGLDNYVSVTHRFNPMLPWYGGRTGAIRARDFSRDPGTIDGRLETWLVPAPEEELGFRTVGWPRLQEEVGLYFNACGGVVELSVYRERRPHESVAARKLSALEALQLPIAEAFETHARLMRQQGGRLQPADHGLTQREAEVVDLLLMGCGTEAIALRLGISRWTVKDHRKHIFRKLGIATLAELFAHEAEARPRPRAH